VATTTTINGFPKPELSDVPNIETAVGNFADAVDARVVPVFSTTGGRDTAISAPSFGQMAAVSGTGELYMYNGSVWVSARPRTIYKASNESVTSSTVAQNDNDFFVSVEANSKYWIELWISYTAATSGDFHSFWTGPSGFAGTRWRNVLISGATGDSDNKTQIDTIAGVGATTGGLNATTAYFNENVSLSTSGTSGTLQFVWCQGTSSGTATVVQAGSQMRIWKVG
jgi:hypothetical protein